MAVDADSLLSIIHQNVQAYLKLVSATATSAQEIEQAIRKAISTTYSAAAVVSENWNARTDRMWRALPAELRAACFKDLSIHEKLALTSTSRAWRKNALATPELWSTIYYPSACPKNLAQFRAMLRWSGTSSLSITLTLPYRRDHEILGELRGHMDRVTYFTTTEDCDGPAAAFNQLFSKPLPRLQELHLEGVGHPGPDFPLDLSGHFPHASILRMPLTPFPGMSRPMPALRDLQCRFSPTTDCRRLFELCPNLEYLHLAGTSMDIPTTDGLPLGPPPRNLKHFTLTAWRGIPDLQHFFAPWAGQQTLRMVTLSGLSEAASVAALFASICTGPWTLHVPTGQSVSDQCLRMHFIANGTPSRTFEAKITPDAHHLLDCAQHFSNLVRLCITAFALVPLVEAGNVILPSVKHISLDRPTESGYDDDWVDALFDLVDEPASLIRVPSLQTMSFGVGYEEIIEAMMDFVVDLRSTIEFGSDRLESIHFLRVREAHVEKLDPSGDTMQGLRLLAKALHWRPPARTRSYAYGFGVYDSD